MHVLFIFASFPNGGQLLEDFAHLEGQQIGSQKLFPLVKMIEKDAGVPIHFNTHLYSTVGSPSDSRDRGSWVRHQIRPLTFVDIDSFPSASSRRAVVTYWRK